MKSSKDVIADFNESVNMTAEELEAWLKSDDSNSAGWPKENGNGETVGHDSGRKIVEILKANPQKKPDGYTEEQVEHMRKVVAYWYVLALVHLPQNSAVVTDNMRLLASDISRKRQGPIVRSRPKKLKRRNLM